MFVEGIYFTLGFQLSSLHIFAMRLLIWWNVQNRMVFISYFLDKRFSAMLAGNVRLNHMWKSTCWKSALPSVISLKISKLMVDDLPFEYATPIGWQCAFNKYPIFAEKRIRFYPFGQWNIIGTLVL